MKNKIPLNTERMKGLEPYILENFQINYLFGLNDLCEKYIKNDFVILELGSNDGVSSTLFSFFAKKVVCVDSQKTESLSKVILENDNIIFNHTSFENFYNTDGDFKYDLIYIDGNHDFNSVYNDIEMFKQKVKEGGYLSGHDCNPSTPEVRVAIESHFPNEEIILFSDSSWLIKIK